MQEGKGWREARQRAMKEHHTKIKQGKTLLKNEDWRRGAIEREQLLEGRKTRTMTRKQTWKNKMDNEKKSHREGRRKTRTRTRRAQID